jgi:hypothetical protein
MQLRVYTFGAEAAFEGWLVNALERLESAGSLRVVDALFVQIDVATGEATAFDGGGEGLATMLVPLIDFRLDPAARQRATADALAGPAVRGLVDAMEPGRGLAAVLLEHRSGTPLDLAVLDEAVSRAHGTRAVSTSVEARRLSALSTELWV